MVAKIAVFDSGLGSLSIIQAIRQLCKAQIIYFADSENFPYGTKTRSQLDSIVKETVRELRVRFSPDLIVMASNTPSLVLRMSDPDIIGVMPPLAEAKRISKSKRIGILATKAAVDSRGLSDFIKDAKLPRQFKIIKIDGSNLVNLVQAGEFLTDKSRCTRIIRHDLSGPILNNSIDTVTLSSTHLPFLKELLEKEFPDVRFIDPGDIIARKVLKKIKSTQSKRSSLCIFTSGDPVALQDKLLKLGIKNRVKLF